MILRDYRPEDFARLCELDRICFPPGIAYTAEEMRFYIEDRRGFTLVAETGTPRDPQIVGGPSEDPAREIVGFLIAHLERDRWRAPHDVLRTSWGPRQNIRIGHIVTIDVHPHWQGCGIGGLLLREAEERLRRSGARRIILETAADNFRAIRFYEKHGYTVLGRIRGYYLGETDALCMGKVLEFGPESTDTNPLIARAQARGILR